MQDLLSSCELEEGWTSLLFFQFAEPKSELEDHAEADGSSTALRHRPFPTGPRKRTALSMQSEKPSWKESFWDPPPASDLFLSLVFCRKRTVCSSISAFSTLRRVASYKRKNNKNSFLAHSCIMGWWVDNSTLSPLPAAATRDSSGCPSCGLFSLFDVSLHDV